MKKQKNYTREGGCGVVSQLGIFTPSLRGGGVDVKISLTRGHVALLKQLYFYKLLIHPALKEVWRIPHCSEPSPWNVGIQRLIASRRVAPLLSHFYISLMSQYSTRPMKWTSQRGCPKFNLGVIIINNSTWNNNGNVSDKWTSSWPHTLFLVLKRYTLHPNKDG